MLDRSTGAHGGNYVLWAILQERNQNGDVHRPLSASEGQLAIKRYMRLGNWMGRLAMPRGRKTSSSGKFLDGKPTIDS
jgi:hypothetical protein